MALSKLEKRLISENVELKSALSEFLGYAEEDDTLTEHYDEPTVSFPNVVNSMSKERLNELIKIIG